MKVLNDSEFNQFVSEGEKIKVIDFFAEWCGPCRMLGPIFEEVSNEIKDADFAKVNVDDSPNAASKFGVRSIPTLVILKNGEEIARNSGVLPKEKLTEWVNSNK
jgi:thioredoxin 1